LLFEAKNAEIVGFDFAGLRLIRLGDPNSVDVVYSIQGELRNASFRVVCTFADGAERDELPSREDSDRMSLLRAITGGVVARFLADHSSARPEGLSKMEPEKFEARIKDLQRNIDLFPNKKEFEDNVWWDEQLRQRSLEAAKLETEIWDDPYRDKIYYTGTNPKMTVDNAFEKLDIMQEDWINGKLDPRQRARVSVVNYQMQKRQSEMGYPGVNGEPASIWDGVAEKLAQKEGSIGIDVSKFA